MNDSSSGDETGRQKHGKFLVCGNKHCEEKGAAQILDFAKGLCPNSVVPEMTGCLKGCENGPNVSALIQISPKVKIYQSKTFQGITTKEEVLGVLESAFGVKL
ncbi:unnamed protein product [Heterosigma akashiwo]|eukprot:CAMPEP_0194709732 /NCGR_PEP_ID=MMETSP0296-20130528/2473_1 /TAXON_ID=39354 /ORGANISM="Heterosigma akashiwo, Strain CCMP2393" /LENGTH=102 /DNA_ID=CAMNT_0039607155 /DNA_START=122 /DNA_END=430 /DNA_ORIENTATION=+